MIEPVTIPYPADDAGQDPAGPSYAPMPAVRSSRERAVGVAAAAAAVTAALGALIGWIWVENAPRVRAIRTDAGIAYADPAQEQPIGADGWFALLGIGAGLVVAVLAWTLLARYRGVAVLVGITVGSLAAGYVAWWVGHTISEAEFEALRGVAVGAPVEPPPTVRSTDLDSQAWWLPWVTGVAAAQALAAALLYTMIAAFTTHPDLRPGQPEPPAIASTPWLPPEYRDPPAS